MVYAERDKLELVHADSLLVDARLAVTLAASRGRLLGTDVEAGGTALSHTLVSVGPRDIAFSLRFPSGQGCEDDLRLLAYRSGRMTAVRLGDAGTLSQEVGDGR
jgi:hypothetical protein